MTPGLTSAREHAYMSKYWPNLNGFSDDAAANTLMTWDPKAHPQTDRESDLLDIIGAYDFLRMQGLTPHGAALRLGLAKGRDELVRELDSETARRATGAS